MARAAGRCSGALKLSLGHAWYGMDGIVGALANRCQVQRPPTWRIKISGDANDDFGSDTSVK